MGRRDPSPDHAKREAFARLIAEGVPSARACRMVGIHPRTGERWRNGRRIPSGGRVLDLPPVITIVVPVAKRYSAPREALLPLWSSLCSRVSEIRRGRHDPWIRVPSTPGSP
jgi:hypothetical protein